MEKDGTSARGGNGTSYSGGPGGGAAVMSTASAGNDYGGNGYANGYRGNNGTGGLLIVYGDSIVNVGTISSNGVAGGAGDNAGGGSSGGGSVNVFCRNSITKGTITAAGGGSVRKNGGAGGAGCVSTGSIATGTYVSN